jgi:hypothetical protein
MSVSAISASSAYQQVSSTTNQGSPRGGAMKSLVDSINNGDMTGAKSAFDALQKNRPGAGAGTTSSSGTGATTGTSQRDQDIAALGKAIDSGDADAAKQALAKLRDDGKNAAGAAQGAQGAQGAHHHHHGHKAQATGTSSATSGSTQDTTLTYSASASGTQTAAPGSTIDVSV